MNRFDVDDLDEDWPFEIDQQASHLFKHPGLGLDDINDGWTRAAVLPGQATRPLAHGRRSIRPRPDLPLAPANAGDRHKCRPMGCYVARRSPRPPLPGGPMTNMTPEQENAFYAQPDNQVPKGPPVRRKAKLSEPVPVRFPDELLQEVRDRAAADDRSVSNWIRRAVEHELARSRG